MKTETLRRFVEVVYTENINKAAKNMNLPQQSLSKNMKSLENEFGVILFEANQQGDRADSKRARMFMRLPRGV